jgi:uncharacterized protein YbaR (Trm112 family)
MLNPNDLEKAKLVQMGLSQFEELHMAVREPNREDEEGTIICQTCDVDFPCERMITFMLVQSMAALSAMIPSGNMAGLMARFSNKK